MTQTQIEPEAKRNKGFEQTHRDMIDMAVRLIAEKGADALSIAELARAMGVSRGTVYYHFDGRDAMLAAVKAWVSEQLARGMDEAWPVPERTIGICRLVLENPELFKLWTDDFISGNDIRDSYSVWDQLVEGMQQRFDREMPGEAMDAEVYCTIMLTVAFIAPRIFARSVRPDLSTQEIVSRFVKEQRRVLKRDHLDWDD